VDHLIERMCLYCLIILKPSPPSVIATNRSSGRAGPEVNPRVYRILQRVRHLGNPVLRRTLLQVEREEWLSHDEVADLAWERQRALVRQAYMHSGFYRRKYDAAGFHPDHLQRPEDFVRVPILTRDEVREHAADIVCDNVPHTRLVARYTSGSTGVPLMIYRDRVDEPAIRALYARTIGRWGLRMGSKTVRIWGLHRHDMIDRYEKPRYWRRFLTNSVTLDAYGILTNEKMTRFAELLRSFRPDLIISYVSAMEAFARFLDERGGADFQPKAIWLTAESTHSFQKELIERVFRSTVYDMYGSVEVDHCAAECDKREGLHINADMRTVEVVDEIGQPLRSGETGELVVTDLINYAAPLIRYRTGDLGRSLDHACTCGRGMPLMSSVTGRIIDMFVLPDGSQIYGGVFATFFYDHVNELRSFQVHQTRRDRAIVRIVPLSGCEREILTAQILQAFSNYTSGKMQFEIQFVERIDHEASGKFRYVKSDVANL